MMILRRAEGLDVAGSSEARTDRRWLMWLLGVFALSRVIYYWLGVRFLWFGFWRGPHSLDIKLLQDDLVRSLWYLHAQPPLLNAYLGVVLKIDRTLGIGPEVTLTATYLLLGAGLAIAMFLLMRELRVPAPFAFGVTSVFMLNPATVLYENWVLYTYPVAVFLCASGLFFIRYLRGQRGRDALLFGVSIALVALTRASYHLLFVLLALGMLLAASGSGARRKMIAATAIPFVVVLGLYAKNFALFGTPSASTWTGLNLAKIVFQYSNPGLLRRELTAGHVFKYAKEPPFQAISVYTKRRPHTGIPALDQVLKSTGEPNANNRENIAISDEYLSNALSYIRAHPLTYARLVGYSFRFAAVPAEDYIFLDANRDSVEDLISVYRVLLLQPKGAHQRDVYVNAQTVSAFAPDADQVAWLVVVQYISVLALGPVLVVQLLRHKPSADPIRRAALIYLSVVVFYGVTVSNLFDLGENMRSRFETDPIVCAATAALVASAWLHYRRGRSQPALEPA